MVDDKTKTQIQVILQQHKNHKSDEDHDHTITTKRYYDSYNNYHHRHHHHQDMSTMVNLEDSSLFFGHRFSSYGRRRLGKDYETLENNIYTQAIAECGKVGIDSDVGASSIGGGDNNNIITLDSIADFVFQKCTKKD